eukprot:GHVT01090432.1.p1 GENE.GHVT01090432.1~~GHVT01090432.1.p1  ORF type:complete len:128 (-),score=0.41 GHVT01090432.1:2640-3023(-)
MANLCFEFRLILLLVFLVNFITYVFLHSPLNLPGLLLQAVSCCLNTPLNIVVLYEHKPSIGIALFLCPAFLSVPGQRFKRFSASVGSEALAFGLSAITVTTRALTFPSAVEQLARASQGDKRCHLYC